MVRGPQKQKLRQWREILARYNAGHYTIAEFCKREGVSQATFYNWKKKLVELEEGLDAVEPRTLPIRGKTPKDGGGNRKDSVQSQKESSGTESMVIRLPSGIELELGNDKEVVAAVFERMLG